MCWRCLQSISARDRGCCLRCGMPAGSVGSVAGHGCSWCRSATYPFDACVAAVRYEEPVRGLILRFKRAEAAYLARPLAWLLCYQRGALLERWSIDVAVPVPRHWRRRLWMGHNHVAVLADELNRLLGYPFQVAARAVYRRRSTRTHRGMGPKQRRANVAGAFAIADCSVLCGRRVLLIDDVMTTGATLSEMARVIRRAKPAGLYAAVLARARAVADQDRPSTPRRAGNIGR